MGPEFIRCPVCGNKFDTRFMETYSGSNVYRCPNCGNEVTRSAIKKQVVTPLNKAFLLFSFVVLVLAGAGALYFKLSSVEEIKRLQANRTRIKAQASWNRKSPSLGHAFEALSGKTFTDIKKCFTKLGQDFRPGSNYFTFNPKDGMINEVYVRKDTKTGRLKSAIFYLRPGINGIKATETVFKGIPVVYDVDPEVATWENISGTWSVLGYKNFITLTTMENKHLLAPERYTAESQGAFVSWFRYLGAALAGQPVPLSKQELTTMTGTRYRVEDVLNAGLGNAGPTELLEKFKKDFPDAAIEFFVFGEIQIRVDLKDVSYMQIRVPSEKGQHLSDITFKFSKTAMNRAVAGLDCTFGKHTKKVKDLLKKQYEDAWSPKNGVRVSKYGDLVRFYGMVQPKRLINTVKTFVKCLKSQD